MNIENINHLSMYDDRTFNGVEHGMKQLVYPLNRGWLALWYH
jgi:hypothetical protein